MQIKLHVSTVIADKNKILLVKEKKKTNYGKWNLPGGHVDAGETFPQAAVREVLEETGLRVKLKSLIGVYTGYSNPFYFVRTAFLAHKTSSKLSPGKDILGAEFISIYQILRMKDYQLVRADVLKKIIRDYKGGVKYNLKLLSEF